MRVQVWHRIIGWHLEGLLVIGVLPCLNRVLGSAESEVRKSSLIQHDCCHIRQKREMKRSWKNNFFFFFLCTGSANIIFAGYTFSGSASEEDRRRFHWTRCVIVGWNWKRRIAIKFTSSYSPISNLSVCLAISPAWNRKRKLSQKNAAAICSVWTWQQEWNETRQNLCEQTSTNQRGDSRKFDKMQDLLLTNKKIWQRNELAAP